MPDKPQKINIGMLGGQTLSARVGAPALAAFRSALGSEGWHDLATEEGTLAIDLAKVVYVLLDTEGHRVGFGT